MYVFIYYSSLCDDQARLVVCNAIVRGLMVKPWMTTSVAPGSQVVTNYLNRSGLTRIWIMFNLGGYYLFIYLFIYYFLLIN